VPALIADQTSAWLEPLRGAHVEEVLLPILLQLVVIIVAARLFALLFRWLGQPGVVGEIAAGLALGPSVLGALWPEAFQTLFHPTVAGIDPALFDAVLHWIFTTLAQLGLIFLLFLIGLEFDFSHLKWHGRSAVAISLTGIALPFALGLAVAAVLLPHIEVHPDTGQPVPALGFALFMGAALSITALPILGRIMIELGIQRTRVGAITIASGAVDDAAGWIILATVAAIVGGSFAVGTVATMLGLTVAFAAAMIVVARPLLVAWFQAALRRGGGQLGTTDLAVLLVVLLLCSIATSLIGIFAIFGAFLLGAVLSGEHEFRVAVSARLRDLVTAFFLPIFFTYTGLRTDVGTLGSTQLWLLCGLVLAAALAGKFGGCTIAARFSGFPWRESACIGVMMNTRALMELIVINVGYEMRVIPPSVFCMLVIMALVTTIMCTPILVRMARGTELEAPMRRSEFARRRPRSIAGPEPGASSTPSE
jgi:Kef-type K+ transport system membrane component KefB